MPSLRLNQPKPQRITPLARRIAMAHGIDPLALNGSGPGGRIDAADVRKHLIPIPADEAALASFRVADGTATSGAERNQYVAPPATVTVSGPLVTPSGPLVTPSVSEGSSMTISEDSSLRYAPLGMTTETVGVPQPAPWLAHGSDPLATAMIEVDVTESMAQASPLERSAILVAAAAAALPVHPWLNARWDNDAIMVRRRIHVAVGLPTPNGLAWRLVRDAGDLLPRGVARVLNGPVTPLEEATFTVAMLPSGATWLMAQPPLLGTAAALSCGVPTWQPVVRGAGIVSRLLVRLSLCYDARVLDHRQALVYVGAVGTGLGVRGYAPAP